MGLFWTSLSVLWSMLASVVVSLDRLLIEIIFKIQMQLGPEKFALFIPSVICLVIAGVLDWKTILEFYDRTIRYKWGYAGKGDGKGKSPPEEGGDV